LIFLELQHRDDFLVGQAIRLSTPAVAGAGLELCCSVLQHLDFIARRDDFLSVGQAILPVGQAILPVGQAILPAAAFQAALWLRLRCFVGQLFKLRPFRRRYYLLLLVVRRPGTR
jgi:hypothetical protein